MRINVSRILVGAAAVLFAGIAVAILAAPEAAAQYLGLDIAQPGGRAAVRADLGGLFAGLAALCGTAAWSRRREWSLAAACMLTAIAAGRAVNWIASRTIGADVPDLLVEVAVIAGLLSMVPQTGDDRATAGAPRVGGRRAWRRTLVTAAVAAVAMGAGTLALSSDWQQRLFDAGAERRPPPSTTHRWKTMPCASPVCGSSAPLPSAARAKACVAVFAGGKYLPRRRRSGVGREPGALGHSAVVGRRRNAHALSLGPHRRPR